MPDRSLFKYRAFGLNIESDFEIDEMLDSNFEKSDVTIILAETPDRIENPLREGVRFQLAEQEFLLNVDDVASYYVSDGNSIRIEKRNGSTFQEVRLFLLGVVFSALLHQRGMVPFHGSTLLDGTGKSFMLCGRSGIGKSTLTACFIKKGFQLLSDDISVVNPGKGEMLVYPSFPFIKLWKDVMDQVEFSSENGTRLRKPLEKYGYHMEVAFRSEHARLNTMVVLNVHNKEGYQTEHLKGVEKFNALKNQTFRFQFLTDRNKPIHFTVLNEIAGSVNVYRITRPQAPMDIEKLYQVVKKIL